MKRHTYVHYELTITVFYLDWEKQQSTYNMFIFLGEYLPWHIFKVYIYVCVGIIFYFFLYLLIKIQIPVIWAGRDFLLWHGAWVFRFHPKDRPIQLSLTKH
jgi:hypothetical protein